jgi:hypothetical protein
LPGFIENGRQIEEATMHTENHFSRQALPSRSPFVAIGAALFIAVSALGSFAYNIMTTAHAGAQFAAKQDAR